MTFKDRYKELAWFEWIDVLIVYPHIEEVKFTLEVSKQAKRNPERAMNERVMEASKVEEEEEKKKSVSRSGDISNTHSIKIYIYI